MPPYLTKADIIMEIKADLLFLPAIGHFCKAVFSRHPCLQGREDQLAYKLELIIYEASSNVIRHAYTSQEQGKLKLKLQFDEGRIILQVIDYGPGFDPSSIPTPDVTNPQVSGMGLYIIRKTVDILKYGFSEQEGGNVMHMEKQL